LKLGVLITLEEQHPFICEILGAFYLMTQVDSSIVLSLLLIECQER